MSIVASIVSTIPIHGLTEGSDIHEEVVIHDGEAEVTVPAEDFVRIALAVFAVLNEDDGEQEPEAEQGALDIDAPVPDDAPVERPRLVVKRSAVSMD